MEYQVVTAHSVQDLMEKVQKDLNDGWELVGWAQQYGVTGWYQTMTKTDLMHKFGFGEPM